MTRSLTARLAASVADPILRILVTATLISRVGRGIFLAVTVLYFTLIVGLSAGEVAVILAASSAAGVLASFASGWLADRFPVRRLLLAFTALEALGLICYALIGDFGTALAIAIVVGAFGQAANTSRMAILARAFAPEGRVHARAVLRTVTNLAIAVGSGVGAIALAIGTADAYRWLLVIAGISYLLALVRLVRLPASVDEIPAGEPVEPLRTETGSLDAVANRRAARRAAAVHSPWRDPRYLLLTALCAVFGMQFGVGELAVPLWITQQTEASEVLVAAVLILNTVVVICFQVPLSRGTHDFRVAGRAAGIAAWLMAGACVVYALAAGIPAWIAIIAIILAALGHAFAEVLSQASGWGLSFELADPVRMGTYQGLFGAGYSIGAMAAPLVVAGTTESMGFAGWMLLAAVFLASGLGIRAIARRAARTAERVADAPAVAASITG
ncbi:MFS transporter [Agromyces agglutinans]|uniref:MFS transporter n=1 Tax=Agromyces agglutinans TaxID=2662258 RepID=UPI0028A9D578|nr:MFS transporter [Agromyces agglutinans]